MGISEKIVKKANTYVTDKFNFKDYYHVLTKEETSTMMKDIKYLLNLYSIVQVANSYNPEKIEEIELSSGKELESDNKDETKIIPALHHSSRLDNRNDLYKMGK